jgi:NAD(P)-dependent dehydrogenase (short-subunit alcohol dehydrogenase family)
MVIGAAHMNPNVLITGASRGLGAAMAKAFWRTGSNLVLVARNELALNALIESLESRGEQTAFPIRCDLSSPGAIDTIIQKTQKKFNYLDVLINNAAIQGPIGPSWNNDWDAWHMTMEVDLFAPIHLSQHCAEWMIPQKKGKIICISGGGATNSRPNFSAYAVAKTGLVRFCETLADELRDHNIQVNCIAPGAMATVMTEEIVKAGPEKAGQKEYDSAVKMREHLEQASLDRAAELAVFLASPAGDGISGKLISAVWDPWVDLPAHVADLQQTDIYTLRRIVPRDRGKLWGAHENKK